MAKTRMAAGSKAKVNSVVCGSGDQLKQVMIIVVKLTTIIRSKPRTLLSKLKTLK